MTARNILLVGFMILAAIFAWRIGERLSADAIGMAIGVLFGILAGIPAALLVIAADRRRNDRQRDEMARYNQLPAPYYQPPQPPVIIVAGHTPQRHNQAPAQIDDHEQWGWG